MFGRRRFLTHLLAFIPAAAAAQQAIMQGSKAVVCDGDAVTCPNGHKTCRKIDAPIAIGNDSYQNPECVQLRDYHLLRCDVCHVLFTRE